MFLLVPKDKKNEEKIFFNALNSVEKGKFDRIDLSGTPCSVEGGRIIQGDILCQGECSIRGTMVYSQLFICISIVNRILEHIEKLQLEFGPYLIIHHLFMTIF